MSNQDRYTFFINDLIEHKKCVLDCCRTLSFYLHEHKRDDEAKELLHRAFIHDNSKIDDDEMEAFLQLRPQKKCFTNADDELNNFEKERIAIHWKKNRHHPEYFDDVTKMTEIDIMEMVCDWAARSLQYNTNLIEFVETRQENRFKFPDDMFNKIMNYCKIMQNYIDFANSKTKTDNIQ